MANVPWHAEVREFAEKIAAGTGGSYDLAVEHAHSCCVLLAKPKFKIDGVWHTHIDFQKFTTLVQRYYESDGKETFTSLDYCLPTPHWAVYNAPEAGFDPSEARWRRKKGGGVTPIEYRPSESGCG